MPVPDHKASQDGMRHRPRIPYEADNLQARQCRLQPFELLEEDRLLEPSGTRGSQDIVEEIPGELPTCFVISQTLMQYDLIEFLGGPGSQVFLHVKRRVHGERLVDNR